MPVFFQKIPNDHFNIEQDFVVNESKGLNMIVGFFGLLLVAGFLSTIGIGWRALVLIIPGSMAALVFIRNGATTTTVMIINKTGFYYYGELITNWDNFIDVEFVDDVPIPDANTSAVQDRFYMMVRYGKDGKAGYFGRKIPFTDTQDKSEEEIIAAIKFYHTNCMKAAS